MFLINMGQDSKPKTDRRNSEKRVVKIAAAGQNAPPLTDAGDLVETVLVAGTVGYGYL